MILSSKVVNRYGSAFYMAVRDTLEFEGFWVDDPVDRGGETKYGITKRSLGFYSLHMGQYYDMADLTLEIAIDIYHRQYWVLYNIEDMPDWAQPFMFDWVVHAGPSALKSMQRHVGVKPDGLVGPRTLGALDTDTDGRQAVRELAIRRMRVLCRLVRRDPTQAKFIVGWWNRVSTFME